MLIWHSVFFMLLTIRKAGLISIQPIRFPIRSSNFYLFSIRCSIPISGSDSDLIIPIQIPMSDFGSEFQLPISIPFPMSDSDPRIPILISDSDSRFRCQLPVHRLVHVSTSTVHIITYQYTSIDISTH